MLYSISSNRSSWILKIKICQISAKATSLPGYINQVHYILDDGGTQRHVVELDLLVF